MFSQLLQGVTGCYVTKGARQADKSLADAEPSGLGRGRYGGWRCLTGLKLFLVHRAALCHVLLHVRRAALNPFVGLGLSLGAGLRLCAGHVA